MAKQQSSNKDIRKLIKAAELAGWTVKKTSGNHLKFVPPDISLEVIIVASTPGSQNEYRRKKERLTKMGVKF
jgi:predicted RNA binding protein YcfA (HicA-like mRNA interferase family)